MDTTTRLLLPFTGGIHALALDYAIQLAEQQRAGLVPLALLSVEPGTGVRVEHLQQAQDFLEITRHKAQRHGVPLEAASVYTSNVSRSIEAFAGEMDCEAVILFLSETKKVLLEQAEIRALLDYGNCNVHVVLFPAQRGRHASHHSLHIPLPRYAQSRMSAVAPDRLPTVASDALPEAEMSAKLSFFQRVLGSGQI